MPSVTLNEGVPLPLVDINGSITGASLKSLNLKLYLEGLFDISTGMMRETKDFTTSSPVFGNGIADQIMVSLKASSAPYNTLYNVTTANLKTDGTAMLYLPLNLNSSYYIVLSPRNGIETWSSIPITFSASAISYNFSDQAEKSYGSNTKPISDKYCLVSGDVNKDGFLDAMDLIHVDNASAGYQYGYLVTDLNGDGIVDDSDLEIVKSNVVNFVSVKRP